MKLPRDLSGIELAKALERVGYRISRRTGSHLRLTADLPVQHHVIVPAHDPLAAALAIDREELLRRIS